MKKKRIALVMQDLVKPTEEEFIYSGGDRYTRDLARLVRDIGMEPTIFQVSSKPVLKADASGKLLPVVNTRRQPMMEFFRTTWEGFPVVGLPSESSADFNMDVAQNTQEFDATVYFHMNLAYPRVHRRSVSISHGIWFDHVKMPPASDDKWGEHRNHLQSVMSCVDHIVSVDTNTINFFGGLFAGRFASKFIHIPNAVDISVYKPMPEKRNPSRVRVLFPRRHEILRGATEMERLSEDLHAKHKHAEFHLCGSAHTPEREAAVKEWSSKYERISWYRKTFDEMPQVYQEADIAIIPTIGCEGTSYSCVPAGTEILTIDGPKSVERIEVGEFVLTHEGRYRPVTETMNRPADELVQVNIPGWGAPLELTPNHPVLAMRPPKRKNEWPVSPNGARLRNSEKEFFKNTKPEWIPAGELTRGDLVVFPRYKAQPDWPRMLDLMVVCGNDKFDYDDTHIWSRFSNNPGKSTAMEVSEATGLSVRRVYACRQYRAQAKLIDRTAVLDYMRENDLSEVKKLPRFVPVTEDLMRLLGYYVAEGYTNKCSVNFAFHIKEEEYHNDVITLLQNIFGVRAGVRPGKNDNGCRVESASAVLRDFVLSLCGTGARKKRIPLWFYDLPDNLIAAFLKGAYRGDGYYGSEKLSAANLTYVSASQGLLWQMNLLLGRLGVHARTNKRIHKCANPTWSVSLGGKQAITVFDAMDEALETNGRRVRAAHSATWCDERYFYTPIDSVERRLFDGIVYNFEVADDHSYIAGGVTVHNCLEAQASGLPVVSTYVGGLSEMVIDGFNGIKVAPRLDELRNAVDYLIRNPDERLRMGKNARAVAEKFNIEKWNRKWADVLKDLTR